MLIVYKIELVVRIRRLGSICWAASVDRIIRLATVGNVAGVVKEIVVLIVSRQEWVARTAILSILLGISRLGSAGSVASLYMVTINNINSIQARISR